MFDVVKKTGLSVAEAAQIVRVSRIAVFNWKAKRTKPHPQFKERLEKFNMFLVKLHTAGKLPLSEDLSRTERKEKVAKLKDAFKQYER
jgi:hypothetical protein